MIKLSIIIPVYNQPDLVVKALDSIPWDESIEVIVIDDCSTDNTYEVLKNYKRIPIKLYKNDINRGVGFSKYFAYGIAQGEYAITIDSDDWVYTDKYKEAIKQAINSDKDIIYIDNDINDGSVWSAETRCATWYYFVKIKFLRDNNLAYNPTARRAGDWYLMEKIRTCNPSTLHLDIVAYHYNYPREGSLVWNYKNGVKEHEDMSRNN